MVMDANGLETGFRLGDWVVDPRLGRITRGGHSRAIAAHHVRILQILAAHHGEVVDRRTLRDQAWPRGQATDEMLRMAMRELHRLLGDTREESRYIVKVAKLGYALIAQFELLEESGLVADSVDPAAIVTKGQLGGRIQNFAVELKRRHVFKVLGSYLVGIFILLQVAETTFAPLHLPDWWMTALTILAVTGIPIVGVLAWAYEITPAGIVLDSGATARIRLARPRRAIGPWLVTGVALMAGVTGFAWWRSIGPGDEQADEAVETAEAAVAADPDRRSVAVLPLVDMTSGGKSGYIGDGFAEEISAQLAQVPGLRVAARTSAFEFKGKSEDVRKIGAALGVRNVLEGSIRRDNDKLRVTVQLIDTVSGYHLWAGTYDRRWADVLAIQDEISRSITQALKLVLTPEAERSLKRPVVSNLDAYDIYLAGTSAMRAGGTLSDFDKAGDLFRKAVEIDPGMARAYAGLCEVGLRRYQRTGATDDVTAAEVLCRKALKLEPDRAETEMALGRLYLASGRREQAESIFSGLVASRPLDVDARMGLAQALENQGRGKEAEQAYLKAVEIDPGYWRAHNDLGNFLLQSGRIPQSIAEYRKSVALAPGNASAINNLGAALLMDGQLQEAVRTFETSLAIEPTRSAHSNLGTLYYYQKRYPEAVREYESAEAIASSDHGVVGALADALWQLPGRRPEAVRLYQRASGLAESALKVNPTDASVWAQLAYYSGRTGDSEAAANALARAEVLGEKDMYAQVYIALVYADKGGSAAARAAISRAENLGYPRRLLLADPQIGALVPGKT
jgi:TolB-like protein/Flp pilus assembly protein TadD/DNA-binding winged helix-turn-helix (wHTH) protein